MIVSNVMSFAVFVRKKKNAGVTNGVVDLMFTVSSAEVLGDLMRTG